jgi:ATP-dependent Clp protease adaptor protein ClpS
MQSGIVTLEIETLETDTGRKMIDTNLETRTMTTARPSPAIGKRPWMQGAGVRYMAGKGGSDDKNGGRSDDDAKTGLVTKTRPKTKKPALYKVLLLNDDYTPMEFVVHVLERYFSKGREEATRIMLHVHHKGVGICGVFTYEIAETKVTQVMDFSRQHDHPLQCTMEKE